MAQQWAVVEVDEDGMPQQVQVFASRDEALDAAVTISVENGANDLPPNELRQQFDRDGYVTDGGWTTAIIAVTRPRETQ